METGSLDEFMSAYDYDEAFDHWWEVVREGMVDLVGADTTEWLQRLLKAVWANSPTARRVAVDNWVDLQRSIDKP